MNLRRALCSLAFAPALVAGANLPTSAEALALCFPGLRTLRREHYLTEAQVKRVKELSGVDLPGAWIIAYEAMKDGQVVGVGFFDTHLVRTLNETALVAISADGRVLRVEVVAFREPLDYLAKPAWVAQLQGKALDKDLKLNRAIRPLSGATLTANALTDAARRCLALWQVLYGGKP
jgi:hypothetical protein